MRIKYFRKCYAVQQKHVRAMRPVNTHTHSAGSNTTNDWLIRIELHTNIVIFTRKELVLFVALAFNNNPTKLVRSTSSSALPPPHQNQKISVTTMIPCMLGLNAVHVVNMFRRLRSARVPAFIACIKCCVFECSSTSDKQSHTNTKPSHVRYTIYVYTYGEVSLTRRSDRVKIDGFPKTKLSDHT